MAKNVAISSGLASIDVNNAGAVDRSAGDTIIFTGAEENNIANPNVNIAAQASVETNFMVGNFNSIIGTTQHICTISIMAGYSLNVQRLEGPITIRTVNGDEFIIPAGQVITNCRFTVNQNGQLEYSYNKALFDTLPFYGCRDYDDHRDFEDDAPPPAVPAVGGNDFLVEVY